jgi:hypothetical protein
MSKRASESMSQRPRAETSRDGPTKRSEGEHVNVARVADIGGPLMPGMC